MESEDEKPGATGKFPEGKLNEDDKGEIKMIIGIDQGKVIIHFGNIPISWIAMTKDQALAMGRMLFEKADLL
jgi:hypothetical protein